MNPTLIGLIAVVVWGASLPLNRIVQEQIGLLANIGILFGGAGILSLIIQRIRREPWPEPAVFRNPYLYGRWLFFVLHEAFILSAVCIVARDHLPFVILLNYLWPTAIIFCSILIAGVKVTRTWAILLGSLIVLLSLAFEIVGPSGFSAEIFARPNDCLAYTLAFIGAISWGLYCALTKRAGEASGGGRVVPLFQLTLGIAFLLSLHPSFSVPWHLTNFGSIILIGYPFLQCAAYLSWDFGMRRGNVVLLSLGADFIPWISLLAAHVITQVSISHTTIISVVTLVIGAMITRYGTLVRKITN